MLVFLCNKLCVTWVGSQIYSQSYQLFAYNWLRAVNYELVDQGYALCVGEGSF